MADTTPIDENLEKLKLETQNLNILKNISQQCCSNTVSIKTILSEFDDRLAKLERDIQPVYKETGNLQAKQSKLISSLEKLDHVIHFYSTTTEVNEIIRAGPTNQLDSYMLCIKKLKTALQYFSQNNPDSPEHMNVSSLFSYGREAIEKEFKLTLQRISSPIAPITLQDIVDDEMSEHQMDSNNSGLTSTTSPNGSLLRHQVDLPTGKINDLKIMCEWLCYNCHEDLINIYADIRSDYISKSLKLLQDFKKSQTFSYISIPTSSAGGSNPSGSSRGSIDSPDLGPNKKRLSSNSSNQTIKRTPKTIQSAFKRKLHNVIPSDVMSLKSTSSIDDITISEKEVSIYLACITAFHKLALIELSLLTNIVPTDLKIPIYSRLIQESLRFIANEANSLTLRVKKSTARHDFTSALNLFPILRYQTLRRHDFNLLFDGCESEALVKFQGLTITFQTTISRSLEEFAQFIHTYNDMKVPDDGTVHELTNNVMIFMEQLHPHLDIMSSVIPIKDMLAMENTSDKNKNRLGFAQYIFRLLCFLSDTIERKAEIYTSPSLVNLFKLNNFHYILKRLRKYGLLEIVQSYSEDIDRVYEKMILEAKENYIRTLSSLTNYLIERHDTKSKSIKERFAGFNKEFQELYRLNKAYAVPDSELRTQLRELCKLEVLQLYRDFYNHYLNYDFSKSKEKYIKFSPDLVSSMIDQFFESN